MQKLKFYHDTERVTKVLLTCTIVYSIFKDWTMKYGIDIKITLKS